MRLFQTTLATLLALCASCAFTFALSAQATSFDCGKAKSKVEHIICDNAEISKLDDELSATYSAALRSIVQANSIKQEQKQWMKERSGCADAACVKQAYEMRLQGLSSVTEKSISNSRPKLRFTVTKGEGWSVCESYARYLNSLPENDAYPVCHLKLSPDYPDLKEPDWEVMDIPTHLELAYSIEKIIDPKGYVRPVDTFEHWKAVYEQQIHNGEASPSLRRTHLALLENGPIEIILAYESDRGACAKNIKKYGYSDSLTRLFLWDEKEQKIQPYVSYIAFGGIPKELVLFQGRPFTIFVGWEFPRDAVSGELDIDFFKKVGTEPYASLSRCRIGFEMPRESYERIIK